MDKSKILDLVKKLHHSVDDALEEYLKAYGKECKDDDMGVSLTDIIHMNEQAMVTINAVFLMRVKGLMDGVAIETGDRALANAAQSRMVGSAMGTIQQKVLPDLLSKDGALGVVRFMIDSTVGDQVDKSQEGIVLPEGASGTLKEVIDKIRKSVNANGTH